MTTDNTKTAKEFIEEQHDGALWEKILVDFAKIHVEAALKAASENGEIELINDTPDTERVSKNSILNSYPLENIK